MINVQRHLIRRLVNIDINKRLGNRRFLTRSFIIRSRLYVKVQT